MALLRYKLDLFLNIFMTNYYSPPEKRLILDGTNQEIFTENFYFQKIIDFSYLANFL